MGARDGGGNCGREMSVVRSCSWSCVEDVGGGGEERRREREVAIEVGE